MRKPLFTNRPADIRVPKGIYWEETMRQAREVVKDLPKVEVIPVAKTDEQIMAELELKWFFRTAMM